MSPRSVKGQQGQSKVSKVSSRSARSDPRSVRSVQGQKGQCRPIMNNKGYNFNMVFLPTDRLTWPCIELLSAAKKLPKFRPGLKRRGGVRAKSEPLFINFKNHWEKI